jgi:hypothetical protein
METIEAKKNYYTVNEIFGGEKQEPIFKGGYDECLDFIKASIGRDTGRAAIYINNEFEVFYL